MRRFLIIAGSIVVFVVAATVVVIPAVDVANDARAAEGFGWSYAFVLVWRDVQVWLTRLDWMTVFGAVLIGGTAYIFLTLSRSDKTKFDFADAFAGENGRTSMAKLTAWIGSLTAAWIMVSLQTTGKMSEGYLATFLGILVLGKVGTEAVGVFRQAQIARTIEAGGPAPGSEPQPVGSVKLEVPIVASPASVAAPVIPSVRRPLGKRGS